MNEFFLNITINSVVSLTINVVERADNNTAFSIIFPVVVQTNLQKLRLINLNYLTNQIVWPVQSTLEHLTIRDCSYHQYRTILSNSLHLRTLVIRNRIMGKTNQTVSSYALTTFDSTGTKLHKHLSNIIYFVV
ncbi:hypothetical protein I4U23_005555 [Adineta vaga]|nr:hypothetical protein I4U23_005555 [Adineta vaga]